MYTRLSYRRFLPEDLQLLPSNGADYPASLCGMFVESEELLDDLPKPRGYKSVAEWFVNLETDDGIGEIEKFIRRYGLLRWNWTHQGQGGGSKVPQFDMPLSAFRESQAEMRQHWASAKSRKEKTASITQWLSTQLARESAVDEVPTPDQMWKLSQPQISLQVNDRKDKAGIHVQLVLGDLWQAMCCQLLNVLTEQNGSARVCANDRCTVSPYFVSKREKKFCCHECAKQVSDRNYARAKRARLKRQLSR